ncbi:MAG: ATPase [Bacteroidetes bacterium]|nr:MAG: ATPase [Bacteroidota bacterium]
MNTKRIVITGGPGTGKTSIINELIQRNYKCLEEISRQVTLEAREQGIDQLFLTKPLLFSELLLEGRKKQFNEAQELEDLIVFLDRGIPDVLAYMDFIGDIYPEEFISTCNDHKYDQVFILAPWQEIYISDSERYENFDQAIEIHDHLLNTYSKLGYNLIDVPFQAVNKRTDFILNSINSL